MFTRHFTNMSKNNEQQQRSAIASNFTEVNESPIFVHYRTMVLKLYYLEDGPPSLSCRQVLEALKVPYERVDVNFYNGDHMTEEYAKVCKSFILRNLRPWCEKGNKKSYQLH